MPQLTQSGNVSKGLWGFVLRGLYYDIFNPNLFNMDIFVGIVKNSE